ncbi:MAG TPA: hypothetical protein VHX38_29130 [Pseudonocardiaceae bacterium]|nr:hypothetical protein [Pseudonocardiaceae bacterium]
MRGLRRINAISAISAGIWIASWRVIYLEIFRWHHMTRTLRFNPPPTPPGATPPTAGLPLRAACFAAVAAPLVFLATVFAGRRAASSSGAPAVER